MVNDMPTWITGVITGGFSFLTDWWKGKQAESRQKLAIMQERVRVDNELQVKRITAELDEDFERVKQMSTSWKDEWFLILFSIPLVNLFISPFVDLLYVDTYKQGMLATAATEALNNLDSAPLWFIIVILTMLFLSWGYRKGLDRVIDLVVGKVKGK